MNRYEEALECFHNVTNIEPNNKYVISNIGIILLRLNQFREAITHFDKILATDQDNEDVLIHKAEALINLDMPYEAIRHLGKTLAINPANLIAFEKLIALKSKSFTEIELEVSGMESINKSQIDKVEGSSKEIPDTIRNPNPIDNYEDLLVRGKVKEFNALRKMEDNALIFLEKIVLKNAKLAYINLSNADLTNVDLSNAFFTNSNLSHGDFSNSTLYGANFDNTNLKGAKLKDASIISASFNYAKNSPISIKEIRRRGGFIWAFG